MTSICIERVPKSCLRIGTPANLNKSHYRQIERTCCWTFQRSAKQNYKQTATDKHGVHGLKVNKSWISLLKKKFFEMAKSKNKMRYHLSPVLFKKPSYVWELKQLAEKKLTKIPPYQRLISMYHRCFKWQCVIFLPSISGNIY